MMRLTVEWNGLIGHSVAFQAVIRYRDRLRETNYQLTDFSEQHAKADAKADTELHVKVFWC